MHFVFAIYDEDTIYATRLMEILKRNNTINFKILVFTKEEAVIEYLKKSPIEILLLGENLSYEPFLEEAIALILCLSTEQEENETAAAPKILKYQKGKQIWDDIITCYYKRKKVVSSSKKGAPTICSIFAPYSFGDEMVYAECIAGHCAENQRVLYIPLEFFSVRSISISSNTTHSLSELIYFLKNESLSNPILTPYIKYHNRLAYLEGLTHGFDILSLNKEDATQWINVLSQNLDFDCIIFFLGFYSEFTMEIVNQSTRTIHITKDEIYGKERQEELYRQMEFAGVSPNKSTMKNTTINIGDLHRRITIKDKKLYLWNLAEKEIQYLWEGESS